MTTPVITNQAQPTQTTVQTDRTYQSVLATAAKGFFAGAGAGIVAAVICVFLGADWLAMVQWSMGAWLIVMGLFWLIVFTSDPVRKEWEIEALKIELDDQDDMIEALEAANATLAGDVQAAKAEHASDKTRLEGIAHGLRQQVDLLTQQRDDARNYVRPVAANDPVRKDAETLVELHYAGNACAQRDMMARGWTQGQYAAAMAFLASKGVVSEGTRPAWLLDAREDAYSRIELN